MLRTDQVIEDVPLVDHDGDERLVLGPLDAPQVPGRLVDQGVEQLQEVLVRLSHHLCDQEQQLRRVVIDEEKTDRN